MAPAEKNDIGNGLWFCGSLTGVTHPINQNEEKRLGSTAALVYRLELKIKIAQVPEE